MKNSYEIPAIVVRDVESDSFMDNTIVSDGGGQYHEDINPDDDQGTDDPVRAGSSVWSE